MSFRALLGVALVLLLGSCARSEAEVCADKIAKISAIINQTRADLFRQWSECRAQQIEFPDDREMAERCASTYHFMASLAEKTIADADRRAEEPDVAACLRRSQIDKFLAD